ncbi:MAG: hypothetical protein ACRDO8_13215 [Nocardioidaceae bacterium]
MEALHGHTHRLGRPARSLADAAVDMHVTTLGLPTKYVPHGSRSELLGRYGLDVASPRAATG